MTNLYLTPRDDIQSILNANSGPISIYLKSGIYRQKLEIAADDVTVIGDDRETTVIEWDDYALKIHPDGREYNTFRTYTLCVTGNRARLENLTVLNSNTDPAKKGQCVALSVHSKNFYAKNVKLKSTQDTLFLSPFPDDLVVRYRGFIPERQLYSEGTSLHLFENCRIEGTVDFIFGGAEAYFKNCDIVSLYDDRRSGFIAAPCHHLVQKDGFYFIGCNLLGEGAGKGEAFLSRPWRGFGKCAFVNCRLGEHINPLLFDKWNDTDRDKTARFAYYKLDCAFKPAPVPWARPLTDEEAESIINRAEEKFSAFNR